MVDRQRAQAEEGGGGSSMRMAACSTGRSGEGVRRGAWESEMA
jgi:hypothetical protein